MRHHQFRRNLHRRSFFRRAPNIVLTLIGIAVIGTYSFGGLPSIIPTARGCEIKGNVSIGSREKIFHVPGQQDYLATRISPEYGERWFCSEDEAKAAGWRKAGR